MYVCAEDYHVYKIRVRTPLQEQGHDLELTFLGGQIKWTIIILQQNINPERKIMTWTTLKIGSHWGRT